MSDETENDTPERLPYGNVATGDKQLGWLVLDPARSAQKDLEDPSMKHAVYRYVPFEDDAN